MNEVIKCHVRVEGGKWLTAANAYRIQIRSTTPSDRSGNRLPTPIERFKNDAPYFQCWRIMRHKKKGFAFVEVCHGGGICGARQTVRELAISALGCYSGYGGDYPVAELLPVDVAMPGPLKHADGAWKGFEWCVKSAVEAAGLARPKEVYDGAVGKMVREV